jgi:CRP/FNR family transcriptional regulator
MLAADDRQLSVAEAETAGAAATFDEPAAAARLADLISLIGMPALDDTRLASITFPMRRVRAGEVLYRAGDAFTALYIVKSGFFKAVCVDPNGIEQLVSFPMGGEVLGLDGLDPGRYTCDAVALESSQVAVVSFARLVQLAHEHPGLERLIYRLFSRELVREHGMIWLLGMLNAEARVAAFLLDLSDRFGRLGYSPTSFVLRMTRAEIGSYLGLKLETVSRTLSALAAAEVIAVERRTVTVKDRTALRRVADPIDAEVRKPRAVEPPATTRRAPSLFGMLGAAAA